MTTPIGPHSVEAEQSVLGGLLLDNSAWTRAHELLTPASFSAAEHHSIYAAIADTIKAGQPADVITVFERLQAQGQAEASGGLVYLNSLAQSVPSASNMRRYAEIVREHADHRALLRAMGAPTFAAAAALAGAAIQHAASASKFVEPQNLDVADALFTDQPDLDYVLPGLVRGTLGAVVSPGGTGKSVALLEMAAFVAAGIDLLGLNATLPTGRVRLMLAEDPEPAVKLRLRAIGSLLDSGCAWRLADSLTVTSLCGRMLDVMQPQWYDYFRRAAEGTRLMVFDTLRRIHTLDENDSGQMAELIARLETYAVQAGTAIVFAHHTAKSVALAGNGDLQQASRGSSVLVDNIRWQMYLAGMSKQESDQHRIDEPERQRYVRMGVSKQNYGLPLRSMWLSREAGGVLRAAELPTQTGSPSRKNRNRGSSATGFNGGEW